MDNLTKFETPGNPSGMKTLTIEAKMLADGRCDIKINFTNLVPDQLARLSLILINQLTGKTQTRTNNFAGQKILIANIELMPNDSCSSTINPINLTVPQQAKLTLSIIKDLAYMAFDKLGHIKGTF